MPLTIITLIVLVFVTFYLYLYCFHINGSTARITAKITNPVCEIIDMMISKLVCNKRIKVILDWDERRAK